MSKDLLPCPFCGADLKHKKFRVVFADDIWEHPTSTDCPLSKTELGDPFHIYDNQSDIESWNKRTPPAQPAQRTWVGSGDLEDSNAYQTPPAQTAQRTEQEPVADEDELSNGLALALHDAVLIRIGKDDEATRQAIARIDKLVAKYTNEAAHSIKE